MILKKTWIGLAILTIVMLTACSPYSPNTYNFKECQFRNNCILCEDNAYVENPSCSNMTTICIKERCWINEVR